MDKKGGLAIVLSAATRPKPKEDEGGDEELTMVAEDLISAIKDGDAGKVADALKAAYTVCQGYDGIDEGDE